MSIIGGHTIVAAQVHFHVQCRTQLLWTTANVFEESNSLQRKLRVEEEILHNMKIMEFAMILYHSNFKSAVIVQFCVFDFVRFGEFCTL